MGGFELRNLKVFLYTKPRKKSKKKKERSMYRRKSIINKLFESVRLNKSYKSFKEIKT